MRQWLTRLAWMAIGVLVAVTAVPGLQSWRLRSQAETLLAQPAPDARHAVVRYPLEGTLFPPGLPSPSLRWEDAQSDAWIVSLQFAGERRRLHFRTAAPHWTPSDPTWTTIQQRAGQQAVQVAILGHRAVAPTTLRSLGSTHFSFSGDSVTAPLFYREVPLPFLDAVKDPGRIRWRFGPITSPRPPPVVLEGLPVCGNCHSFSRDGAVLGMDVDYANNKGSYVVTPTRPEMALATSDIITWDHYRPEDHELTYGFLSQVSPDGRHVVSTVKDKSVFVPKPELEFSQLFFPIKGILAVYATGTKTFAALPGADDPRYVQSNPAWSPDGRTLVFARAPAYHLRRSEADSKLLLSPEDCAEFLREGQAFQFDLYQIPFNEGRGGTPQPLAGASNNGRSNFFPKYSPDGRWIVFCQAQNYMLLQPDSELFIIPATGGTARRLRANTGRMNSWHSWSPDGRWLVFASKANTPYTQLFLTHIDAAGDSTPPVLLAHLSAPDRAANIPEFVSLPSRGIARIHQQFLDDTSFARAGYIYESQGEVRAAVRSYEQALAVNPRNVHAHQRLGFLLVHAQHRIPEGLQHTLEALRLNPDDGCAHHDLGLVRYQQQRFDEAVRHFRRAVDLLPTGFDSRYNPADLRADLGMACLLAGDLQGSTQWLAQALAARPTHGRAHHLLALALAQLGATDPAAEHYAQAVQLQPATDQIPALPARLASNFAEAGRYDEAVRFAEQALALAQRIGNADLARAIEAQLAGYRQHRITADAPAKD